MSPSESRSPSGDEPGEPVQGGPAAQSTALLTDHYELTMLRAALRSGIATRRAVFEVFARGLPEGRRYGVVAGAGRLCDAVCSFRFGQQELAFLESAGVVDERTRAWLADYRFTGSIWGYPEGECYFPGSPVLVVESTFAEAVLLETLVLSILNHDSAIASAASRMTCAAGERPIIEMGGRRAHEEAAVASARAAYIGGFTATSNLMAGYRYGVPTTGTSAHAFTLAHDTERDAFTTQVATLGKGTTILVDTYDLFEAVRTAVDVAGPGLGAVRLDSGDLLDQAHRVRALLDSLGATETRIVVTGDLDEHAVARLAAAPVDGYGVGTALVTGSGHPTAGLVYKLVARATSDHTDAPVVPVAKRSEGKPTRGGKKWGLRAYDTEGVATAELVVASYEAPLARRGTRALLVPLVTNGRIVGREPLEDARDRHRRCRAELPTTATMLTRGEPAIATVYEEAPL